MELLENLKKWFKFKYEIIYFYNVYGKNQISKGKMATVIGIFENQYINKKPLTIVIAWQHNLEGLLIFLIQLKFVLQHGKINKCAHYSISHKRLIN